MAGRRGSTRSAIGFAVVAVLMGAANALAQPVQPPGSPAPNPAGTPLPPAPTAPQSAPGAGDLPPTPPLPGVPGSGTSGPVVGFGSAGGPGPASFSPGQPAPAVQRFNIKILPNTPTKDLLPTPPPVKPSAGPEPGDDLAKVPEVEFQARPAKGAPTEKLAEQTARQLAKINHLNAKKTDAFMTALLESRPDLAGLPFAMGDDCRTSGERARQFTIAVNTVRQALAGNVALTGQALNTPNPVAVPQPGGNLPPFWSQYVALCQQEDAARGRTDKAMAEHVTLARMAALTQMLAPESAELRLGLVKYLTAVPHVQATKALARMAIFSAEDDVRSAAIDALKVRREKDYTDILVKGLRYPWPAVARRSADAIAKLGLSDLVPELIAVLDEADPRMPRAREAGGKKVAVVRELVKVNHHRNCMMCHAPGSFETVSGNVITAEVPVPGQQLPLPSEGYRQSSPDLMIRIDVTYLRQDFSAMLPVADAHPWPDAQRFDFLVRERELTPEEADAYREKLTPKEAGVLSPYHRAALKSLREITGKDAAPTAEAWRKLLDLPAKAAAGKAPEGAKARD
jgi:hypothetical protein